MGTVLRCGLGAAKKNGGASGAGKNVRNKTAWRECPVVCRRNHERRGAMVCCLAGTTVRLGERCCIFFLFLLLCVVFSTARVYQVPGSRASTGAGRLWVSVKDERQLFIKRLKNNFIFILPNTAVSFFLFVSSFFFFFFFSLSGM